MIPPNDDRDDRMDEFLIQGARDYNQPGPVPRDAMWARIAEARARSTGAPSSGGTTGGAHESSLARRRMLGGGRGWLASALAAGLLLAAGISIGRRMERGSASVAATTASSKATNVATPGATGGLDSGRELAATSAAAPNPDSLVPKLREETQATQRRVRELAAADAPGRGSESTTTAAPSVSGSRSADNDLAYRLVVLQHLAGSEAMITAFRTSAHHGAVDAQIASWSRDLLSTTRMLESSPATQDPTMRRLLEDLDLVITQIVQYTTHGTHDPDELDLIEQSIAKRGVITKLRSTIPTREPAAGT